MSDPACTPLADHLAERTQKGLVDIKFYVHNPSDATPAKVCAEAEAVFAAIKANAVEELKLADHHAMRA